MLARASSRLGLIICLGLIIRPGLIIFLYDKMIMNRVTIIG